MALTTIKTGGLADNSVTDAKVADAITVTGAQTGITQVGTLTSLTTSGIVSTSKIFEASGQNVSHGASRIKISQESSALSEFRFYGADTSTAGSLRFIGSSSDGSVGNTRLTIASDGNATFAGSITTTSTGLANAPSLAIDNPSSSSYIHALEAFGANMTQGQTHIFCLGKEGSTKNTAVLGYKWDSAGSNDNLFTIEHWGTGALVTVDGVGNTTFESTVQAKGLIYAGNDDTDEERFRVFNASTGSLRMYAGTQAANYNADDNNFVLEVGTRGGSSHFKSIHAKGNCLFASVTGNVEVGGGSKTSAALRVGGANDSGGRLYFQYNGDSSYIDAWGGHGGTERLRDLKIMGRKLEFNTGDSPVKKVEIQSGGDMVTRRIFPQTHNTYSLGASGDFKWTTLFATNGTINTSDETLKENIIDCDEGAEFIKSLRPVSFNWKDIERNGTLDKEQKHYGFIAQEIIKTPLKDSVTGEEGSYGMNYMNFIAPIVKALQEALKRIETLESA